MVERNPHDGIRISVGAQGGDLVWLFVREILGLLAGGIVLGVPIALVSARWVGSMLYHVSPSDPAGIAATLALMALGGIAATWIPARRALHADPVRALRHE